MALNINSIFTATAQRNLMNSNNRLGENLARASSGKRINKAADDAAGLSIAMQLQADIRSADQAQRNVSDGASLTRVAEGGLSEISSLLTRGRELSIQAANGTLNDQQRSTLNQEITSIKEEVNRITGVTEFNGQKLLDGSLAAGAPEQLSIQAGIQSTPNDRLSMNVVEDSSTAALNIDTVDISTQAGAQNALASFDNAMAQVTRNRSNIGSLQNRLDHTASNLAVQRENLSAANATISDLDYAKETSAIQRNKILSQAAVSTLRQGQQGQASIIGSLLNIKG
ncbi:Flagellin protein FlaA [hydrothermal vent metagenome]|uniref:Flagellin protein FlaA n=1 Tax=hydrothermal vent metagenome TaxID=652676 RepID=A0A3B1CSE1_9ZZZZ